MRIAEADLRGQGDNIVLDVTCLAPSLGWTEVELIPVRHMVAPVDGIQEFILKSTAPTETSVSAVELFSFSFPIQCDSRFQGIRIRNTDKETLLTLRNPVKNAEPIGTDMFWITSFGIRKDQLILEVSYPGGPNCQHSYQLAWDGIIQNSFPPQVTMELSHNSNSDGDKVLLPDTLHFDLSTIEGFPTSQMIILIKAPSNDEVLFYTPPVESLHQSDLEDTHGAIEELMTA